MDKGGKGIYFKLRLEAKDIRELARGPATKVCWVLMVSGERRAMECFSCGRTKDVEKS